MIGEKLRKKKLMAEYPISKTKTSTIINSYAPTEVENEQEKLEFYENLEETRRSLPRNNMLMMIGDFYTKIEKEEYNENEARKKTIYNYVTNNNGSRL